MNLQEKCQRFGLLKELREWHEHNAKVLGSELEKLGADIFDECTDNNVSSMKISGAIFKDGQDRSVSPVTKFKPSVLNEASFFQWLRERNHGALIKETVHAKTLESFVKTQKENNQELPAPEVLTIFTVTSAKIIRAPKRS